ncbi:MAG: 3-oxoacyl-[acyl-carrier-protein] reductase [Elusimicrobia bacterium]|nr:3-oxoacyl-[acyl-carrier-protein] reductase [Elusimicrobiota bacterium]
MKLKGKVAIITGAAQGIGRAIAELFAREGASVALADLDEPLAKAAAAEIAGATGSEVIGLMADVRLTADCEAAVQASFDKFAKIDILVNNAGLTRDNLVLRMKEEDWDLVLDVNLKGAFLFTKAVLRAMLKARSGRIINIASVAGLAGNAGQANYAASKGGLIALTKSCAKELASRGILVNAVAPGLIRTRMTGAMPEDARERMVERSLLGRMGEPEDVAYAALYLAGEEGRFVTGQVLGVNGGLYI